MNTVTVSPKYQVVIPLAVRVELIPVRPIESVRGLLRGMDTSIEKEGDRL